MPPELINADVNEAVHRMFLTALLLTGSTAGAEYAVQEGVTNADSAALSCDAVFDAVVLSAIATRPAGLPQREIELRHLPAELHGVLLLPPELRQLYVLRLLLGLSVSQCSQLLSLDFREVEPNTVSAVVALAAMRTQER